MSSLDRNRNFSGDNINPEIKQLKKDIFKLETEIQKKREQIRTIREECDHDYSFYCSGPYDDTYICEKCWHEIER